MILEGGDSMDPDRGEMNPERADALRALPSVGSLLEVDEVQGWVVDSGHGVVVSALRVALDEVREGVFGDEGSVSPVGASEILLRARAILEDQAMLSLRRVINATGVVLHTNLGRAPLCEEAVDAVAEIAAGYCDLEFDLETGRRGKRVSKVGELLCALSGAEAAVVVNNNAAATLLILRALCCDREVVVSRGQLVEIGGSFRIPDVMAESGAVQREVGTTNRTRISDYEDAISEDTAALLRVHTSNYRIVGFTEEASLSEMVACAHARGLLVIDDLGSGAMFDFAAAGVLGGVSSEPSVVESVTAGADVVCFSGDKLLGGPQAGIILGRSELIDAIEKHPLMRALRLDKMALAALDATLRHYRDQGRAVERVPTLAMLSATTESLADKAARLERLLSEAMGGEHFLVGSDVSFAGGGSLPGEGLETVVVRWRPAEVGAEEIAYRLRVGTPAVVARVNEGSVVFDVRTIFEHELSLVARCVATCLDGN